MQRLRTRAQFEATMAGATVSRTAHFALHRASLDATGPGSDGPQALFAVGLQSQPWIGAVVPKRWAKRAVTRNTIKRQIYAVAHDLSPQLPTAAHVVRLRAGFERSAFPSATSDALRRTVRAELQRLMMSAHP